MSYARSLDKVVASYFSAINTETFEFEGVIYPPRKLNVSPLIFRGFDCPSGCGACCARFSLDFLPGEPHPYALKEISVEVTGRKITYFTDDQDDHWGYSCKHLQLHDGRCGIHSKHPFSCDFELLRFVGAKEGTLLIHKLFSRGSRMLKIDGESGAKCSMLPVRPENVKDLVRKLSNLKRWSEHFQIKHKLNPVLDYVSSGPHSKALYLDEYGKILKGPETGLL